MSQDFRNEGEFDVSKFLRSDIDEFDVSKLLRSDIDNKDNDGQSSTRTTPIRQQPTTPLPEQPTPTPTPDGESPTVNFSRCPISNGQSDLNQLIGRVLENLCGGRNGPLLVQFWALIVMNGLFSLETQISRSFIGTADDALGQYCAMSRRQYIILNCLAGVSTFDVVWNGTALATLCLPVYLLVREQRFCGQILVGILEIVSYTKETCLQFFKEARVCDLFQKEGLICLDVVPEHLGMQLDGSTQGSEIRSNVFEDHTRQFTHEGVFNSKDQLVTWARDVGKKNAFAVVIKSSDGNRVYLRCERHGQTRAKERNGQTRTKKCDCPFDIRGHKSKENGTWSLEVRNGFHNHQMQTI